MSKYLLAASALALMTSFASAQSITFDGNGNNPTVNVNDGVYNPNSSGTANTTSADGSARAQNGGDRAEALKDGFGGAESQSGGTFLNVDNNNGGNSQATVQLGNQNAAGTVQFGTSNEATTLQIGDRNKSFVYQDGRGVGSTGPRPNGENAAAVLQVGKDNSQITSQVYEHNSAATLQKGDNNTAATIQASNYNSASTLQYGNYNRSFIGQSSITLTANSQVTGPIASPGFEGGASIAQTMGATAPTNTDNAAAVIQAGNYNQSAIFQGGSNNAAFAVQVTQPGAMGQ